MYKEKGETLYYIYGIPGRFAIEEHPFRESQALILGMNL